FFCRVRVRKDTQRGRPDRSVQPHWTVQWWGAVACGGAVGAAWGGAVGAACGGPIGAAWGGAGGAAWGAGGGGFTGADVSAVPFGADTCALPDSFVGPTTVALPETFTCAFPDARIASSEPVRLPFTIVTFALPVASTATGALIVQSMHFTEQLPLATSAV